MRLAQLVTITQVTSLSWCFWTLNWDIHWWTVTTVSKLRNIKHCDLALHNTAHRQNSSSWWSYQTRKWDIISAKWLVWTFYNLAYNTGVYNETVKRRRLCSRYLVFLSDLVLIKDSVNQTVFPLCSHFCRKCFNTSVVVKNRNDLCQHPV